MNGGGGYWRPPGWAPHPQQHMYGIPGMYPAMGGPPRWGVPPGPAWGMPVQQPPNPQMLQRFGAAEAPPGVGPSNSGAEEVNKKMEEAERERERERVVRERDGGGFSAPGGLVFAFGRGGGAEGNRVNVEKAKNAEAVARRVYEELVEGEKHISVAKVAQSTLTALGVSSFELLGFRMQDVTCLRNLALVEGKVNAYIHCHIAARKMTTLYDLGCELTQEEGVSDFEELGIGPLLCHPLVVRYFSPPDEVLSITAGEVLQHLSDFIGTPEQRRHVDIDEFMGYLQKERKAPTMLHLGVRIQSLGLHVGAVLRAKKSEVDYIKNWEALARSQLELKMKSHVVNRVDKFLSSHKNRLIEQDDKLKRKRQHIYFTSDDEEEATRPSKKILGEEIVTKMAMVKDIVEQLGIANRESNVTKDAVGTTSREENLTGPRSCPYPSAAEEKLRAKRQKQLQAELDIERRNACQMSWPEVTDFVTTLKDACKNRTVPQVLEHLLDVYYPLNNIKVKRKRALTLFNTNPGIGLLYVAITSVKVGLWDSTYDVFQEMQQQHKQKAAVKTVSMAGPITVDCGPSLPTGPKATEGSSKFSDTKTEDMTEAMTESKPLFSPRLPLQRVQAFIMQATHASEESNTSVGDLSQSLCRQFNVGSVEDLGLGSLESLLKQVKSRVTEAGLCKNIYFLDALLSKVKEGEQFLIGELPEVSTKSDTGMNVGVLGIKTNADAVQSLRNAPILADLNLWSKWDIVFCPTLGPLISWLEGDGLTSGIHTLVTHSGAILKIDGSATVDEFLAATISRNSGLVAGLLVSIAAAYGGVDHAPAALIKTYAIKAINVLLSSCGRTDQIEGQVSGGTCHLGENQSAAVALFLLKVLCAIPLELQLFAAKILLPAFSSAVPGSPTILLKACQNYEHCLVLHGLGLCLGVEEWVKDFSASVLSIPSAPELRPLCSSSDYNALEEGRSGNESSQVCEAVVPFGEAELEASVLSMGEIDNDHQSMISQSRKESDYMKSALNVTGSDAGDFVDAAAMKGEDGKVMKAIEVVESIRRDEFGVGQELTIQEHDLLTRQHARMGRALHRLSQDLYSQDSHFVLELVQNADDNSYGPGVEAALVFVVQPHHIVVFNNEEGFTPENLRSLCDVGNSTKAGTSTGYIGHKGIGFKSVFRVTDSPEIHSNGFDVKFDITESNMGFILPTIVPPPEDADLYGNILGLVQKKGGLESKNVRWNTRIDLPIKASIREGKGMDSLAVKFNDIHPSLLLFLHHLRCIAVRNDFLGSTKLMYRKDLANGLVRVVHDKGHATWLVVRHQVHAAVSRPGISMTEVSLAFTLRELAEDQYEASPEHQQVFAFLPLRSYGLRFIVQGDFILPSSREEVDRDNAWNQWLRSEIPEAFMKAAIMFRSLPSLKSQARAVSNYLRFVPLEGEVLGFFSPLPRLIHARLQASQCLPIEEGGWSFPCGVLRSWTDAARKLMPGSLLKELTGLQYLDKDVDLSDELATSLGVQKYGVQTLVDFMKSVCQKKNGIESRGLAWVRDWLIALHDCLLSERQSCLFSSHQEREISLTLELQSLPFIPLASGSLTAVKDGPVWFASQQVENHRGVTNEPVVCFPLLYAELRTVHPIMFCNSVNSLEGDDDVANNEQDKSGKVITILQQLGVRPMSAHHVLRSHVLPAMVEPSCLGKEVPLLVQYLGYMKWHLESGCSQCSSDRVLIMDELKRTAVIVTNNGPQRAGSQEVIHFGTKLGSEFDAQEVLDGTCMKWNEIDESYLHLMLPNQGGSSIESWRKFLAELGVLDFVKISPVERVITDKESSLWRNANWQSLNKGEEFWIVQDWESPELIDLITAVCSSKVKQRQQGKRKLKTSKRCSKILSILDKLWASNYASLCRATYRSSNSTNGGETMASWVLQVQGLKWIKSSLDKDLHAPTTLFQRCDDVHNILGNHASYICNEIQSGELMKVLGLRTKVTVDDCLTLLQHWGTNGKAFGASVAQMARFYLHLSEQMPMYSEKVLATLKSQPSIFLPRIVGSIREEVVDGALFSLQNVCWSDPTGILSTMLVLEKSSQKPTLSSCLSKAQDIKQKDYRKVLNTFYPELQNFFVNQCSVQERPGFYGYIGILQRVAAFTSPSSCLDQVMEVLASWAWDVESGKVTEIELQQWKAQLQQADCTVLPTCGDKWVSLNPNTGLVCVCDDEKIQEEFSEELENLHFLQLNSVHHSRITSNKHGGQNLQPFYVALGVPLLSQVVKREVIVYGSQDAGPIEALIAWALPFAQRYLRQVHPDMYNKLEEDRIRKQLKVLRCSVVDQLFFRYSLQFGRIQSRTRIESGCILEGKTLHVAAGRSEDHCMVYAELSRLFFSGESNQQFANFLHLITMMASLGSSKDDVESYIVNTQGIKPLPVGMVPWKIKTGGSETNLHHQTTTSLLSEKAPSLAEVYLERHAKLEESLPRKARTTQPVYSGWPPRSWVPIPTVQSTAMSSVKIEHCSGPSVDGIKEDQAPGPTKQNGVNKVDALNAVHSWQGDFSSHTNTSGAGTANGGMIRGNLRDSTSETAIFSPIGAESMTVANTHDRPAREQLGLNASTEQQQMTGRAGEEVAFQYLVKKHGVKNVKWVNEDGETGAAFDMIVKTESGQQEFVEVKTTRSQDKDWFEISAREWEFAQVHGDLYTLLRVILPNSEKCLQIIRFSNPVKLCRERIIQLAVILPFSGTLGMSVSDLQIGGTGSPQGIQVSTYKVTLPDNDK